MTKDLIVVSPGLLALIQGRDGSLLPFAREIVVLECQIAGTSYQQLDKIEPGLKKGDRYILFRETENKYDPFAVAIYTSEKQKLGYLPRDKNESTARLLDAGKIIFGTLLSKEWNGKWLRLSIQVFLIDR